MPQAIILVKTERCFLGGKHEAQTDYSEFPDNRFGAANGRACVPWDNGPPVVEAQWAETDHATYGDASTSNARVSDAGGEIASVWVVCQFTPLREMFQVSAPGIYTHSLPVPDMDFVPLPDRRRIGVRAAETRAPRAASSPFASWSQIEPWRTGADSFDLPCCGSEIEQADDEEVEFLANSFVREIIY